MARRGLLVVSAVAVTSVIAVGTVGAQAGKGASPAWVRAGAAMFALGSASDDFATSVAVQADGRILVAGSTDAGGSEDFALVRYTTRGRLDRSFGASGVVLTDLRTRDDSAAAIAVEKDGGIVVAGYTGGKGDIAVVRYTTAGKLDPTFGTGGKVLTDVGNDSRDSASAVAVQPDGKILVAGVSDAGGSDDFALVRYTSGGKLDKSFGNGGRTLTNLGVETVDRALAIALQPDRRIVVAGNTTVWSDPTDPNSPPPDLALARYTTDGKLDSGFGRAGKVVTGLRPGSVESASAVVIEKSGRIVAASGSDFALFGYTAKGKLDRSFGRGGKVLTDFGSGSSSDSASAITIQADGKLVAAGTSDAGGTEDFALARYTSEGRPDRSFGARGTVLTALRSDDECSAVAARPDGRIVAAGGTRRGDGVTGRPSDFALVGYTSRGKLDASFGQGGTALIGFGGSRSDDWAEAAAVQPDGRLVVAGYSDAGGSDAFALVRYTTRGNADLSFGRRGEVLTGFGARSRSYAHAVAVQADGKVVAGGNSIAHGRERLVVARYTAHGRHDASFGIGGAVLKDVPASSDEALSLVTVRARGKILAAGSIGTNRASRIAIFRFTKTGKLDRSFGVDGMLVTDLRPEQWKASVVVRRDGRIVVGGRRYVAGSADFVLSGYTANGKPDVGFGKGGKAQADLVSDDSVYALAIQKNGKILLVGESRGDFAVARYTIDGRPDKSFGAGGKVVTNLGGSSEEAFAAAVAGDGRIVVAGESNARGGYDFAVVRYTTSGRPDASFGRGGIVLTPFGNKRNDEAHAVALTPQGRVIVVGTSYGSGTSYTRYREGGDYAIARYTTNGQLDASFGQSGKILTDLSTSRSGW